MLSLAQSRCLRKQLQELIQALHVSASHQRGWNLHQPNLQRIFRPLLALQAICPFPGKKSDHSTEPRRNMSSPRQGWSRTRLKEIMELLQLAVM